MEKRCGCQLLGLESIGSIWGLTQDQNTTPIGHTRMRRRSTWNCDNDLWWKKILNYKVPMSEEGGSWHFYHFWSINVFFHQKLVFFSATLCTDWQQEMFLGWVQPLLNYNYPPTLFMEVQSHCSQLLPVHLWIFFMILIGWMNNGKWLLTVLGRIHCEISIQKIYLVNFV